MRYALRIVTILFFVTVMLTSSAHCAVEIDTTTVREPVTPERSLGSKILRVPPLTLKIPLKLLKGVARGGVKLAYEDSFARRFLTEVFGTKRYVHPLVSYGANSSFEGGLGLRVRNVFDEGDKIRAKVWYTVNKYQRFHIRYEAPTGISDEIGFTIRADYNLMPRESFYGIGNGTQEGDKSSFTRETGEIHGEMVYQSCDCLSFAFIGGYSSANHYDGEETELPTDLDTIITKLDLPPTAFRSTRLINLGARFRYDWRDHKGQPSSGGTEELTVIFSRGVGDSDGLTFWQGRADLWQYLHLWNRRTLAARVLVHSVEVLKDDDHTGLPINLLPCLGGEDDLRGYKRNRFMDRGLALVSLEYRYPLWLGGDAFLYVDEGRVFDSFEDSFSWRDWRYSVGVGIRAFHQYGEMLRITVAWSKEEPRFYIGFGEDF